MALVVNGARGSEVEACCSEAARQGVRPGMPLVEAQSLVRGLKVTAYKPEVDRATLVQWAEACERFSPRVALEDGEPPESLHLDISNLEHLWGSELKLVGQVKSFFTRRGYVVKLAVGETVGAAWAAAHFAISDFGFRISDSGSQSANHNPQSEISLPVQSLRIDEEMALVLRELGIETVGQLMALPRDSLAARFGDGLLRRLDQLTRPEREVIEPRRALAALEASHALEEPTTDRSWILRVLKQLVDRLARQLAARDQGAVFLVCSLHGTNLPPASFRVGLLQPSASPRQLLELIELHLESVQLTGEVNRVELRAAVVGRLGERQGELFAGRWPTDAHQLAVLVNRLSSRLGYERVLRAESRASPIPERAVRWVAAVGRKDKERARRGDKETRRGGDKERRRPSHSPGLPVSLSPGLCPPALPRPLLLYPTPQEMEVVCVVPDGPPQVVWIEKRRERIVECTGPERIETLWWRGPTVRRDYYRVATESGSHLWIFRRLTDDEWFLHGIFA